MNNGIITSEKILEMAKNGWEAIIEMYKNSTPEHREKIIKAIAGLVGFGALMQYLKRSRISLFIWKTHRPPLIWQLCHDSSARYTGRRSIRRIRTYISLP